MNEPSNQRPWQAEMLNADPFSNGPNDLDNRTKSKIFKEITMTQPTGATNETGHMADAGRAPDLLERAASQHKPGSRLLRPAMAMSAAAAVLVAAVLSFSLFNTDSAEAQMLAAAQESVSADVGQIVVSAELVAAAADGSDLPADVQDSLGTVTGTLNFDFEGDDYAFTAQVDDGSEGYNPQARLVDGNLYASENGQSWVSLGAEESSGLGQLAAEVIPGVQNFDATALEQLVLVTNDIEKTEAGDVVTYSGNLQTEEVLALEANKLPAALLPFRLADQGEMPLPEELRVTMSIEGGEVTVVTVAVEDYEFEGVVVNGSVTTDYTGVGEPQTITAPAADEVQSVEDLMTGEELGS